MYYYLNDDHTYEACDAIKCNEQMMNMRKHYTKHVKDEIINGHRVSTVWLGIDHAYEEGLPLLFETMVFNKENGWIELYCDRYSTWNESLEGHKKAVEWVLNGAKNEMD
jgi:hypothetical protein